MSKLSTFEGKWSVADALRRASVAYGQDADKLEAFQERVNYDDPVVVGSIASILRTRADDAFRMADQLEEDACLFSMQSACDHTVARQGQTDCYECGFKTSQMRATRE